MTPKAKEAPVVINEDIDEMSLDNQDLLETSSKKMIEKPKVMPAKPVERKSIAPVKKEHTDSCCAKKETKKSCVTKKEVARKPAKEIKEKPAAAKPMDEHAGVKKLETMADYEELLKSKKPVVVKFSAVWCPPCQKMAPIYAKLAQKYADDAVFAEIDADNSKLSSISKKHAPGLPTTIFIRDGKGS